MEGFCYSGDMKKRPKVGIGAVVVRKGKILIGKRLSSHGKDTWQIPGGHLEFGESFEDTAIREVIEETGLTNLKVVGIISINNDVVYDKHYVSIGVLLESKSGKPTNPEKGISSEWHWCDPNNLPTPFFPHNIVIINNWLASTIYSRPSSS